MKTVSEREKPRAYTVVFIDSGVLPSSLPFQFHMPIIFHLIPAFRIVVYPPPDSLLFTGTLAVPGRTHWEIYLEFVEKDNFVAFFILFLAVYFRIY